jgi:HTH-type transcriptional regulator/antitoxin HigA
VAFNFGAPVCPVCRPYELQAGLPPLDFSPLLGHGRHAYIAAIHAAMAHNYAPMTAVYVKVINTTGSTRKQSRSDAMEIKPIVTKADHRAALKQIEALMSARPGTPDGDRLDVLVTLVEAWEKKRYPMDLPDPIEAIKFRMDQSGLGPKDLVPMIGQLNRVYEVLARKRPLTLQMIRRLHRDLGIPAESLIKPSVEEHAA